MNKLFWMSQIFEKNKNLTISKLTSQNKELLVRIKPNKSITFVYIFVDTFVEIVKKNVRMLENSDNRKDSSDMKRFSY